VWHNAEREIRISNPAQLMTIQVHTTVRAIQGNKITSHTINIPEMKNKMLNSVFMIVFLKVLKSKSRCLLPELLGSFYVGLGVTC
jgi:hypothetical protein